MDAERPSATAQAVAAMRAAHWLDAEPHVFSDPYAIELAGEPWRALRDRGELRDFFKKQGLLHIQGQIVGRARWAEDALERAIAAGVGQYVIVGAGLDSFVLRRRDLLGRLRVFEIDHPATQRFKRAQLARLGFDGDGLVELAAVDLGRESVAEALTATSFSREQPSFFAWLGVAAYLTEAAVLGTLASIRACAAPGSHLAFDYPIALAALGEADRALAEQVHAGTAQLGEPRCATHVPEELHRQVCALGFALVEDLSAADHHSRYFAGRRDGLRPYAQMRLAHFQVPR